jgi:hypothetical protein
LDGKEARVRNQPPLHSANFDRKGKEQRTATPRRRRRMSARWAKMMQAHAEKNSEQREERDHQKNKKKVRKEEGGTVNTEKEIKGKH